MNVQTIKKSFVSKKEAVTVLVAATALSATSAFAVDPTLADLTAAVSFTDVKTAIIAIALASIGMVLIWKGAKIVIHAVRGA